MPRLKERQNILHHPSTYEIFNCLSSMTRWAKLLFEHTTDKPYTSFLKWLLEKNFFKEHENKITVKQLGKDFKADATKLTKWIHAMYEDIFILNFDQPLLFQQEGIAVTLYMKHYDNRCTINLSLPVIPRQYESFRLYFLKAKMGIDYFWVSEIEHEVSENKAEIFIWLKGGQANKFRDFALDKALFLNDIHFFEIYDKNDIEIDEQLIQLNK